MDDLPEIRLLSEEKKIAEANLKLLYTAYYPELFLGYYNQSIQGWHLIDGNEIFTDNSYRFHSAVIGLGIPFISNSQTAKIKANKYQVLLAQNSLQLEIERLQNQIMTQLEVYNKMNSLMKEYNTFLKNSDDLLKATFERLHQDEIDVMQFVFMINQAISTKCAYLELMKKKNQVAVEINYLTSK
jgi:cobalt-zinc-cadmium resistance protein CzcA